MNSEGAGIRLAAHGFNLLEDREAAPRQESRSLGADSGEGTGSLGRTGAWRKREGRGLVGAVRCGLGRERANGAMRVMRGSRGYSGRVEAS